jgi:hypothetical protein
MSKEILVANQEILVANQETENTTVIDFIDDTVLISEKALFKAIVDAQKIKDINSLFKVKEFLFKAVDYFLDCKTAADNLAFRDDPETIYNHYALLHNNTGGILGLADVLHRRIKTITYLAAGSDGDKMSETKKEYIAREASSDLEGVIRLIDTTQRNVLESMSVHSGKVKKR